MPLSKSKLIEKKEKDSFFQNIGGSGEKKEL